MKRWGKKRFMYRTIKRTKIRRCNVFFLCSSEKRRDQKFQNKCSPSHCRFPETKLLTHSVYLYYRAIAETSEEMIDKSDRALERTDPCSSVKPENKKNVHWIIRDFSLHSGPKITHQVQGSSESVSFTTSCLSVTETRGIETIHRHTNQFFYSAKIEYILLSSRCLKNHIKRE